MSSNTAMGVLTRIRRSDFANKVAETFLVRIVLTCIGMITAVLVARILGPEGRGLYAVATATVALGIQFCNFGLHSSNVYFAAKDRSLLPQLTGNSLLLGFTIGSLGALLTWVAFLFVPNLAPVNGIILTLALIWIPFGLAYMLLQNLLVGIGKMRLYNIVELISKGLTVGLICLVVYLNETSTTAVFFTGLISVVCGFAIVLILLRLHVGDKLRYSYRLFTENIRYGFKAYLAAFFSYVLLRSDVLLIKHYSGAENAGYYSVATSMADLLYLFPTIVGLILFAKLSALDDAKEKWLLAKKSLYAVVILIVPMAVIAAFLSQPIITIVFGETFLPSVAPFIILCTAMVFYGANNVVSNYFASIGLPWFSVYVWVFAALANIALNIFAIPAYGMPGAAMTSLACYAALLLTQYIYAMRKVNVA